MLRQACRAAAAGSTPHACGSIPRAPAASVRLQLRDHQTKGARQARAAGSGAAADVTVMAAAAAAPAERPHWRAPRKGEHAHLSTTPRAWRASVAASNGGKTLAGAVEKGVETSRLKMTGGVDKNALSTNICIGVQRRVPHRLRELA